MIIWVAGDSYCYFGNMMIISKIYIFMGHMDMFTKTFLRKKW